MNQPHESDAVMEAFRALRADDAVCSLQPRSKDRQSRIRAVLQPIADYYGYTVEALAMILVESM